MSSVIKIWVKFKYINVVNKSGLNVKNNSILSKYNYYQIVNAQTIS